MGLPSKVNITEVCPRDGFQSLPEYISSNKKVDIINKIMECNFSQIEVTSFVHPNAVPQMKDADTVLKDIKREKNVSLRSEEHTSELQSRGHLVCRLLLEKKKNKQ